MSRSAACSCGQFKVTTKGEPVRISMCHCLACQKRTGSAFGVQAWFPRQNVAVAGRGKRYVRVADSGNKITFHFCPDCGSTVYYWLDEIVDKIAVPVGAFGDPTFPTPRISVYESRRHDWVGLPANMEHLE